MGNLVITRKPGQAVLVGDDVRVTVLGVTSRGIKLAFEAPERIRIDRVEIRQRMIEAEIAAGRLQHEDADGEGQR